MDTPRAKEVERRISADPWDIDGWNMLAIEAQRASFDVAKPVYERLVSQFPPAGKFWRMYAEHSAREDTRDATEVIEIYDRAVSDAPTSIDLWISFVTYVTNQVIQSSTPSLEAQVLAIYERALATVGLDVKAEPLWSLYINFVANHATLSDAQRQDELRRIYQRAVRNPMDQLDVFWRRYTEFENDAASSTGNKDAARTVISELQGKNHDARTEFRARANRRQGITLHTLPVPPRSRSKEISQAQSWRRLIAWEKGNPGTVGTVDLHARVVYAFELALVPLYRYAEFWIEYVGYLQDHLNAQKMRKSSEEANLNTNSRNNVKDSSGKHSSSADTTDGNIGKTEEVALESVLERSIKALPDCVALHVLANYVYVRVGKGEKGVNVLETLVAKHASPLAYIHLMRATWKQGGRDAARKAFSRGRKDTRAAHPLMYVAAATMEFAVNMDSKVPRNVFELGLKNFPNHATLALEFVNWLWGTGDTEYARIVLRKVLPDAHGTTDEVRRLWERWLELEELVGDSSSVDKVLNMWKESGVGRTPGFMQDVLRMSQFNGVEGLDEDELALISAGKDGVVDTSTSGTNSAGLNGNAAGNTGAGKRDPRTGRRVEKTGNLGGKGKDAGTNGVIGRRRPEGNEDNTLKLATTWLENLASTMPPITDPIPSDEINAILRMVMDTPDSFAETRAGRAKATLLPVTGKKRKGDDVISMPPPPSIIASGPMQAGSMPLDVFRARQAAKQARLR